MDLTQLRASLARGEKAALAAALAGIERDPDSTATAGLLGTWGGVALTALAAAGLVAWTVAAECPSRWAAVR